MWVAEALKDGFENSILATNTIDLEDLNRDFDLSARATARPCDAECALSKLSGLRGALRMTTPRVMRRLKWSRGKPPNVAQFVRQWRAFAELFSELRGARSKIRFCRYVIG